jgi:site-specific DNA-cytosine methylase
MMRILGVCGGNGVMLGALKKQLVGNIEPRSAFQTPQNAQWRANFGDTPLLRTLENAQKAKLGPIDVIIGHPDCGHSSILSFSRAKSLGKPQENASMECFTGSIALFRPRVFIMENLPKLRDTFPELEAAFEGYHLKYICTSVTAFGNSQKNRVRLLLVGALNKKDLRKFTLSRKYRNWELKSTGILLKGLEEESLDTAHVREAHDTHITLYAGYKIPISSIQQEWLTKRAGDTRWKVEGRNFTTAPGVYRNLKDKPPNTVRKGNREFNPQGLMMSPRERARIQGIPDSFRIWMDPDRINYSINKGRVTVTKCPPHEVSKWIRKSLRKLK